MKVAYLIGSLNRGGAETLLLDVFRKSSSAPFEMMLIHRKGGMYEKEFEKEKPSCYRITPQKCHLLSYLIQLRKTIQKEHVTIIHAFYRLDAVYAKLATVGLHIPIVITFHGYMGGEAGWLAGISYHVEMLMAQLLCFVSVEQMKCYEKRYGDIVRKKGLVLYNGLNFEKFELESERLRELENEGRIKLCMVGNFNSVRSQIVIVKALKLIGERVSLQDKFDFYFIGGRYNGEEYRYDECVTYCSEHGLNNVYFLGVRDDVPSLLKTMDGFVYSTVNDTFGIAVIEAMAAGLPIIVNNHSVMKEICGEESMCVQYYQSGNVKDCTEKIINLLHQLSNGNQLKAACAKKAVEVRERNGIDKYISNSYGIYNKL